MDSFGPLCSAEWLREHLDDPDLRVIDLRWYLDGRSGLDAYQRGHIPGAVFVALEGEITGTLEGRGRHPLPERDAFQGAMRAAGVRTASRVVVYDDLSGMVAGRLWWLLHYFGHERVAVLDGGLDAWLGELEQTPATPPSGDFEAAPPAIERKLDYEGVGSLPAGSVLLDARAGDRFRGEHEPVDPRAGHVPGAKSAPFAGNLDAEGRFLPASSLRRRFEVLGVRSGDDAVVYCGSGVSACHDLIALELAGFPGARLYPGSWSDWSRRPDAAVETGAGDD
ncbi:MAG: sulfurtransferase [Candidatus Dormiibacterota bacterium]